MHAAAEVPPATQAAAVHGEGGVASTGANVDSSDGGVPGAVQGLPTPKTAAVAAAVAAARGEGAGAEGHGNGGRAKPVLLSEGKPAHADVRGNLGDAQV